MYNIRLQSLYLSDVMTMDFLSLEMLSRLEELSALQITKRVAKTTTSKVNVTDSSLKFEKAEWLNTQEAAEFLRVPEGTLRNLTSNGKIPYVKLGRLNRYSRKELRSLLLSNKRGVLNGY